ncbi:MAG: glycosyl transferase [Thermoflexus sp.]
MLLEIAWLTLAAIHFGVPLTYYAYLKSYLDKPWNLKIDDGYAPTVSIVIPTYDEEAFIESRLDNILEQGYPSERLEIIVVDSASSDRTVELARSWGREHPDAKLRILEEPERRGKTSALNTALQHANGEVVVLADADSFWEKNALKEAVKYFAEPKVGAVTCLKMPIQRGEAKRQTLAVESTYRSFYNKVRVAESKIHSTPIFHGELAAFRKRTLLKIGGFKQGIGADDSHAATLIALENYRAIMAPEIIAYELTPRSLKSYIAWKARRAIHLVQSFWLTVKEIRRAPIGFRRILLTEAFLHLVNPWLLLVASLLFIAFIMVSEFLLLKIVALLTLTFALTIKRIRRVLTTWVIDQLVLIYACLKGLRSKEVPWTKIEEVRGPSACNLTC